jgi:hypothetical protein
MRSLIRGTVSTLPCDTTGFAPMTTRKSVRSTSGTGTASGEPYSSWLATNRLLTSCEPAVKRCIRMPTAAVNIGTHMVWL